MFIVLTCSCYSIRTTEKIDKIASKKRLNSKIYYLETTSGEKVEFSKKEPGRIVNKAVVGSTYDKEGNKITVSIPLSEIKMVVYKRSDHFKTLVLIAAIGSLCLVAIALLTFDLGPFDFSF